MASESVKVLVRVRPLNEREYGLKCNNVVNIEMSRGQCSIKNPYDSKAPLKSFFFDGAYNQDSATEQMYADIVYPLVENVTEGYNGTVFAYGQTGCGKSYTMQGVNNPDCQRGVIPRAFDHIFETISVKENTKYLVHASYLEIYNEEIRDLLGKDAKAKMDLKEHPEKGVYVAGLSMHKVSNVSDCQVVMERGWKNRSTGATLMNVDSSRSHSIFTIYLEMIDSEETGDKDKEGDKEKHIRAGKLNLVDLAGSERQSKTGSTGDRLKEATKINLSLSALGNVISALVDGKSKHVPYRDSKLTRMLQDSLGGNTKTLMIACLSPADNNFDESLSTLRYANRAKNIQNKPKINEDPKDAMLREFQEEINRLKQRLAASGIEQVDPARPDGDRVQHTLNPTEKKQLIEQERKSIREEYEAKLAEKERLYSTEAADKEKLQMDMERLKRYYDQKLTDLDIRNIAKSDEVLKIIENSNVSRISNSNMAVSGPGFPDSTGELERQLSNPGYSIASAAANDVVIVGSEDGRYRPESGTTSTGPSSSADVTTNQRLMSATYMRRNEPPLEVGKNELMSKLQFLRSGMVGGEQVANKDMKDKVKKKRRLAEERREKLMLLNEKMEDDGIMLGVYETAQDDLRSKHRDLKKALDKNMNLQQEVLDIQDEYQREKCDYLDMIRRLEKENSLLTGLLDKVQPLIRRSCNYSNIDKIKQTTKYNEEAGKWLLPQVKLEQTALPDSEGNIRDVEDDVLYRKLSRKPEPEYFQANRRSNQLINSGSNGHLRAVSPSNYNQRIQPSQPADLFDTNVMASTAADTTNWRSVHRLESISAPKKSRKKRDKYSNDNGSPHDF